MRHLIEENPKITDLNNNLLEYTITHCDAYCIEMALEDSGLEMLVSRISETHRTPPRYEKDIKCKFN